jgi:hypothetical protein
MLDSERSWRQLVRTHRDPPRARRHRREERAGEGREPSLAPLRLGQLRRPACDSRGLGRCSRQRGAPEESLTAGTGARPGQGRGCRRRRRDRGRHRAHRGSIRAQRAGRRCAARGREHACPRDTGRRRAPQATPECTGHRERRGGAVARGNECGGRADEASACRCRGAARVGGRCTAREAAEGRARRRAVSLSQARHRPYSGGLEGARARPGRRCSCRIALSVAGRQSSAGSVKGCVCRWEARGSTLGLPRPFEGGLTR